MEISRHWRLNGQRYNLKGTTCTYCGKQFFAPRAVCDACHGSAFQESSASVKALHANLEAVHIAQR
jgi:uncharacterized OB-fold protein